MILCGAPQMAVAAGVCCLVLGCWRLAVRDLANITVGIGPLAIDLYRSIAVAVLAKRPDQAFVASVLQGNFVDEAHEFAL
jgi:hypothetical protein